MCGQIKINNYSLLNLNQVLTQRVVVSFDGHTQQVEDEITGRLLTTDSRILNELVTHPRHQTERSQELFKIPENGHAGPQCDL